MTASFSFVFFASTGTVHSNLGPGQLASIFHVKQIGMIAEELPKKKSYVLK